MTAARARVLCVDDDANVLEGLEQTLEVDYDVVTAPDGARALELLEREGPFTVVISDMRMAHMDGAELLARVRKRAPDSVRILLTGHAEMEAAIAAVNRGQVFRFLVKPCPPPQLLKAVRAAVLAHKLALAEKALAEQTLRATVKALTDALARARPRAFARAARVQELVAALCAPLPPAQRSPIELAAMLLHVGWVDLPAEVLDKLHDRQPLGDAERALLARAPLKTEELIAHIPRLEVVRGMLALYPRLPLPGAPPAEDPVGAGARILRAAVDFAALEHERRGAADALGALRARPDTYDPALVAQLAAACVRGAAVQGRAN